MFATGAKTKVGRISELISTADVLETPLTRKIAAFSRVLLIALLALAALTLIVGVRRGQSAFDMFMAAVALAVGAIPEDLPAAVTITLAIGMGRMARRKTIIRKLPAVETLGSTTTTICSDKTGTLTVNQMTVREIWAAGTAYEVAGNDYGAESAITAAGGTAPNAALNTAAHECLLAGLLCNDSTLVAANGRWEVRGDPSEGALLAAASKAGCRMQDPHDALVRLVESGVRPLLAVSKGVYPVRNVLIAYSESMESAKAMKRFVQMRLWLEAKLRVVTFSPGSATERANATMRC